MQQQRLDGMRVAMILTDMFEQVEMTEPREALESAGARTSIIAPHDGQLQAAKHDEKGDTFTVDLTLDRADSAEFQAVMLPGGVMNADKIRMDADARRFVRAIDERDLPIAVICHAPWLLISAGLVAGRTLTSYHTLQDDLRNAGARWLDVESVTDRNWTSSRSPKDIPAFNRAMIQLFATHPQASASRRAA